MISVSYHVPVLLRETIDCLAVKPDGIYVDGTLGGGGHFTEIVKRLGAGGCAIGIDRDDDAIFHNATRFSGASCRVVIAREKFSHFATVLDRENIQKIDGILVDLGVSSHQIDDPARGFSYARACDLDMRMDRRETTTAAGLLAGIPESELCDLLATLGDIENPARMAKCIVAFRNEHPILTSNDLRDCLTKEYGPNISFKAQSKLFQALRIAVNHELDELKVFLDASVSRLAENGRLVVIAYHSLEDRVVKNFFRDEEKSCLCDRSVPVCSCNHMPRLTRVTRKAIHASDAEIAVNARSRSAQLRAASRRAS